MRRSHFLRRILAPGIGGVASALSLPALTTGCQVSPEIGQEPTETGSVQTEPAQNATQSPAQSKTAELSTPDESAPKTNEVWKVAIAPERRPFATEENGQLVGFDVDLIKAISKICGATAQIQAQPFDALTPMLQAKQIDMGLGAVAITKQLSNSIVFSDPYFGSGVAIITTAQNPTIKTLKSLQEKAIAVELDTMGAQLASDILGSQILTYDQSSEVLAAVEAGKADAALVALPILLDALNTGAVSQLQQKGRLLAMQDFGIVFCVSDDGDTAERINTINRALTTLEAEGTLNELYQRWLGISL